MWAVQGLCQILLSPFQQSIKQSAKWSLESNQFIHSITKQSIGSTAPWSENHDKYLNYSHVNQIKKKKNYHKHY